MRRLKLGRITIGYTRSPWCTKSMRRFECSRLGIAVRFGSYIAGVIWG